MSKHIVVIGAGFGGLAAAIRLQARGHRVTLVEQRDQVGGRAYVYRDQGYTFDGGPTVITAPWLFDELFALAGQRREDALTFVPVDPYYRIFFHDGAHFDYTGDAAEMEARIAELSSHPGDVEGYRRFLAQSRRIFDKGFTELATTPFDSPVQMLKVAPDLVRLQSFRTVYGLVSRYVQDERLRQILSFHPLLIGGNPFQTTSIYALIHHLEREWGVWFAMGGTGAITAALERLFLDLGGELMLSTPVAEIVAKGRRATGVRLGDGSVIAADAVVCNAEVAAAHQRLIPANLRRTFTDRRLARMRYSMSLVVIYFGTNRRYRDPGASRIAHHNIILGPRYRELLADIFEDKVLADDFSLYLHMPTLTDPTLAPTDGDAFYVLAPVPHLGGDIDWEARARPYRDAIMSALEDRFLPDLSRHIVTERMIDPRHFEGDLSSYLGSAFSVEPILTQSAWFRPHNRSQELERLYFVGAGTHPGAGVPGVLSSATIVDHLVAEDFGHTARP